MYLGNGTNADLLINLGMFVCEKATEVIQIWLHVIEETLFSDPENTWARIWRKKQSSVPFCVFFRINIIHIKQKFLPFMILTYELLNIKIIWQP